MTMTTTIKAAGSPSVIDGEQQIADPAPLGLGAFALTTFVLSAANAGWIPKGGDTVVVGLASADEITSFIKICYHLQALALCNTRFGKMFSMWLAPWRSVPPARLSYEPGSRWASNE